MPATRVRKTQQFSVKTDRKGKVEIPKQVLALTLVQTNYDSATHAEGKIINIDFELMIPLVNNERVLPLERNFRNNVALWEIRKIQDIPLDFNHPLQSEVEASRHFDGSKVSAKMVSEMVSEMCDLIRAMIELYRELPDSIVMRFADLPARNLGDNARNHLEKIQDLKKSLMAADPDFGHLCTLLQAVREAYSDMFSALENHIAYALHGKDWDKSIERKIASRLDRAVEKADFAEKKMKAELAAQKTLRESFEKEMKDKDKRAEDVLESIQATAEKAGVGQHARFFAAQAKQHEIFSFCWLLGTIAMVVLLVLWIGGGSVSESFWKPILSDDPPWWTRVLITLVLTSFLAHSVKNYMAHKHNAVVNKHRENALRTYRALADSGPSQETRDIVLHHAAVCIYAPQDSGYVKGSGKTQPASMPVAIRSVSMGKIAGRDEN